MAYGSGYFKTSYADDMALVDNERAMLAAGFDPDQAARLAYGRFPVAGPPNSSRRIWSVSWSTASAMLLV